MAEKRVQLILASASPRRADLLRNAGVSFTVTPADVPERLHANEAPGDYTTRLARAKAVAVARQCAGGLVLGADTVVVLEGRILGKPADAAEAEQMLRQLAGRWHAVMTGVALVDVESGREVADFEKTLVRFAALSEREIAWYLAAGEWTDKAGGYAIQGYGSLFVEEIAGNYANVVGLPVPLVYRLARQLGYSLI